MNENQNIANGVRIRQIIVFSLFIIAISLPILDYVLKISGDYENTENRNKASLPKFDVELLDPFPCQFDSYYSDNHNFRGELLSLNTSFKYNILNISPNKNIVEGEDGWLYLSKYLDSYINKRLFTNIEIDSFNVIFNERSKWLEDEGIKHYIAIVPNKPQIYPEYLPSFIKKKTQKTKTEQFIENIDDIPNLEVIYLKDTLLAEKENSPYELFYKTDQHWNDYGAFVGFSAIVKEIKKDFPNLSNLNYNDYVFDTSYTDGKGLAKILMLHKTIKELEIKTKFKNKQLHYKINDTRYDVPEVFPYKYAYQLFFGSSDTTLPKGLVIRDSFSNALSNLLPESFGETTLIWDNWCYELHKDIVKNEKPDFFLTIIIETNIPFIIYKHPTMREDGFNAIEPDKKRGK